MRAALGLHAGTYPEANYAAEPNTLINIHEAYAGFWLTGKTWLDVGVFDSRIGLDEHEVTAALNPPLRRAA